MPGGLVPSGGRDQPRARAQRVGEPTGHQPAAAQPAVAAEQWRALCLRPLSESERASLLCVLAVWADVSIDGTKIFETLSVEEQDTLLNALEEQTFEAVSHTPHEATLTSLDDELT